MSILWNLERYRRSKYSINKRFVSLILELGKDKMTVGKIYVCLLILESWRTTRFGQIESTGQVSLSLVTVRV